MSGADIVAALVVRRAAAEERQRDGTDDRGHGKRDGDERSSHQQGSPPALLASGEQRARRTSAAPHRRGTPGHTRRSCRHRLDGPSADHLVAQAQRSGGRCQLGWGSAGSGRAGAGWAGCRWYGSGCGSQSGDLVPDGESSGHFGAIVVSGEAIAAGPEMRGDHAEHRQEPLGCAGGAEAFHGAFALPGRLVRVLRPVVQVPRLPVLDRRHHRPMRHLIASELVGDQYPRCPALLGQQLRG